MPGQQPAVRCRMCALAAFKAKADPNADRKPVICPLDLVSKDPRAITYAAKILASTAKPKISCERVERWLRRTTLLKKLRDLQAVR